MRNLRPIGIPHSIFLENLFARTYDASKLEEDTERVRQAYRDHGYFRASRRRAATHIRNEGGLSLLTFRPKKGKRIDITMPIEEGDRYRLGGITFTGNKAVTNVKALRAQFAIKDGDWFNATAFGKGLETCARPTASSATSTSPPSPRPRFDEAKKTRLPRHRHRRRQALLRLAASSSRATPSPATSSSAASCSSKKARSTTAICGR